MIKQRLLLLLILTMVITPVSSAFAYYSSIASPLFEEHSYVVSDLADAAPQDSDHCLHQDKFKLACHASGSCTFHVCGDGGIAAVFLFTQAYSPNRYGHLQKSASRSISSSPEIKPPINSL
jgi:hypothetical protein